ncbi:secretory of YscJ/FliF family protein, partial [Vibrio parahaemolyticus V-223/04]
TKKLPPQYF